MEVTQLSDYYSVIQITPEELGEIEWIRLGVYSLYLKTFQKPVFDVDEMVKWHKLSPGEITYYIGVYQGVVVAFTYFMSYFTPTGFSYSLSGGSMSHREHRGSFLPLLKFGCDDQLSRSQLLLGFCNEKSYPIFTHSYFGWIENKSFTQLKLLPVLSVSRVVTTFQEIRKSDIPQEVVTGTALIRTANYLHWRSSRNYEYILLANAARNHIAILKRFGSEFDLLTLIGVQDPFFYRKTVLELRLFLQSTFSNFSGLNLFLSHPGPVPYQGFEVGTEPLAHKRHLCYKILPGFQTPENFYVEMIDSDTF